MIFNEYRNTDHCIDVNHVVDRVTMIFFNFLITDRKYFKAPKLIIRYFLMLVATGIVSPETVLPTNFCVDFNHFQYIIMGA